MKPTLIVGDIHGEWEALFRKIDHLDLRDATLLCVGDVGIGFVERSKQERQHIHINNFFKSRDIEFLSIKGNHDDPAYFDGSINLSHFKLLPDYTTLTLNDKKFLFVGGAISIDRTIRKEGISYWKDEAFKLDRSKIQQCDVLITHSIPTGLGEFSKNGIVYWCEKDLNLWDDCMKEREDIAILYDLAKPKQAFSGHFHVSLAQERNKCMCKIIDILEIVECF